MSKHAEHTSRRHKKENDKVLEIDVSKAINIIKRYSLHEWLFVVAVSLLALYIRVLPDITFLQAIDPNYIYRMTSTLLENGFKLPVIDTMKYYPDGFPLVRDYYALFYVYGVIYYLLFKPLSIEFLYFAQKIPAILAALYVPLMYLIAKEIFGKRYGFAGIAAGFLFATSNSTIFRSSEGFFEKEPIGGLFILLSFYFFVKSIKSTSPIDGALAGIFAAFAYAVWGGAVMLIYLFVGYAFISILLGKWNIKESISYSSFGIAYLLTYYLIYHAKGIKFVLLSVYSLMVALSIIGVLFLSVIERYFKIKEEEKKIYYPLIIVWGFVSLFIAGFFIPTISTILSNVFRALVYRKQVIESTVAENIPANVDYFLRSFGIMRFNNALDYVFSLWFLTLVASFLVVRKYVKNEKYRYILYLFNVLASLAYYAFLKSSGNNLLANIIFVIIAAMLVGVMIKENNKPLALLLLFVSANLLSFVVKVRLAYPAGMFMSILGGFAISILVFYVVKNINILFPKNVDVKVAIKSFIVLIAIIYVLAFVYLNTSTSMAVGISLSFGEKNPFWDDALRFLRTNTTKDAVVLSWWDFGYWFQTIGERRTLLDGGNQKAYRNVFAAKYFTGRYNDTWDLLYLATFKPTHILLDFTMIGKYAAMSKIANNGKWIDAYGRLAYAGQQGNYLIYRAPGHNIYVPLTTNGTLDITKGIRVMPTNINVNPALLGNIELRYFCTPSGVIDLSKFKMNNNTQYIEECIYIFPGAPNLAFMTFTHPNKKEGKPIYESNFHKLYLEDGIRVPYVKKVFDNIYVRIYEVNYSYIYDQLEKRGINKEFINYTLEMCIDSAKAVKGMCPLYYKGVDLM